MDEDPKAELEDAAAAKQVGEAIDAITADLIRHSAKYPASVRELPRLVASMEKLIKGGKYREAALEAGRIEEQMESYKPTDEPAQEAKLIVRRRVRVLAKLV